MAVSLRQTSTLDSVVTLDPTPEARKQPRFGGHFGPSRPSCGAFPGRWASKAGLALCLQGVEDPGSEQGRLRGELGADGEPQGPHQPRQREERAAPQDPATDPTAPVPSSGSSRSRGSGSGQSVERLESASSAMGGSVILENRYSPRVTAGSPFMSATPTRPVKCPTGKLAPRPNHSVSSPIIPVEKWFGVIRSDEPIRAGLPRRSSVSTLWSRDAILGGTALLESDPVPGPRRPRSRGGPGRGPRTRERPGA